MVAVFRRIRVEPLQFHHFLVECFLDSGRPELGFRLLPKHCKIFHLIHSKFLLDGFELVVQVIFPLLLIYLGLDFLAYLLLDFLKFKLLVKHPGKFVCPDNNLVILKEIHLVHYIFGIDGSSHEVDKELKIINIPYGFGNLPRHIG